jgi:hypothetical protein
MPGSRLEPCPVSAAPEPMALASARQGRCWKQRRRHHERPGQAGHESGTRHALPPGQQPATVLSLTVAGNQRPVAPNANPPPAPGAGQSRQMKGCQGAIGTGHSIRDGRDAPSRGQRRGFGPRGSATGRRPIRTRPGSPGPQTPQPLSASRELALLRPPARKRRCGAARCG